MKLREIEKSEIFDLISQGQKIYFVTAIDISKMSLQHVATLKSIYAEDNRPEKAHRDAPDALAASDGEPAEGETKAASETAEQPQAEAQEEPKKKRPGRPPINRPQIENYYLLGRQPAWIAQEMKCDLSTVYKVIKEFETRQAENRRRK